MFFIVDWYAEPYPVPLKLGRRYDTVYKPQLMNADTLTTLRLRPKQSGRQIAPTYVHEPTGTSRHQSQTISHIVQRFQHNISRDNTRPLPADARAGVIKVWAVRWQDVLLLVLHSGTACSPFTIRSCTCINMGPMMRDGRPPVACVCISRRPLTVATPTHGVRQQDGSCFLFILILLFWSVTAMHFVIIVFLLVCVDIITPRTNCYTG